MLPPRPRGKVWEAMDVLEFLLGAITGTLPPPPPAGGSGGLRKGARHPRGDADQTSHPGVDQSAAARSCSQRSTACSSTVSRGASFCTWSARLRIRPASSGTA
jgi:hypothetical protein